MQEKRVSVRTNLLAVDARVSQGNDEWTDITVRDISDGGLGFVSDVQFTKGTKLVLEGDATDVATSIDINCDVEVIFCGRPEAEGGKYLCGVRFLDMPKQHHTELGIFIEKIVSKYPSLLVD